MAKLINILAASVGGGLVLGAGIRLGEAIATWDSSGQSAAGGKLAERLGDLESRLHRLEGAPSDSGSLQAGYPPRATDLWFPQTGSRAEINPGGHTVDRTDPSDRLRAELQGWMEENVTTRMAEVEARLRMESERGRHEMLDAFVESVQTRVIGRITQLEEEVAGQSAAMTELRECSLRTERSIQQLLGGLDKLIVKRAAETTEPANVAGKPTAEGENASVAPSVPEPQPPPVPSFGQPRGLPGAGAGAEKEKPKSSRWRIFGR